MEQYQILKTALNFLHVEELKEVCSKLKLPDNGKKSGIILRILHFISTGEIITQVKIPEISCAKRGKIYPLHKNTLILKNAYKNDLQTRLFFKQLIGEYFHFTAFGIDWLNDRWLEGNPPTYQEFIQMWKEEYARRKKMGNTPKEEWAYITFIQKYNKNYPGSTQKTIITAWKEERERQKEIVRSIIKLDF